MSAEQVQAWFPRLTGTNHRITSQSTPQYNCAAWAAGCTDKWWEPGGGKGKFWPPGARTTLAARAYIEVFESEFGYSVCPDGQLEPGYEKICIYTSPPGVFKHVARQLPTGWWTSKLGRGEDIEHQSPELLEGDRYGHVTIYLKRPVPTE